MGSALDGIKDIVSQSIRQDQIHKSIDCPRMDSTTLGTSRGPPSFDLSLIDQYHPHVYVADYESSFPPGENGRWDAHTTVAGGTHQRDSITRYDDTFFWGAGRTLAVARHMRSSDHQNSPPDDRTLHERVRSAPFNHFRYCSWLAFLLAPFDVLNWDTRTGTTNHTR